MSEVLSITIGRSEINDIVLKDKIVSRIHARISKVENDLFTLEDLNSTNGTLLLKFIPAISG